MEQKIKVFNIKPAFTDSRGQISDILDDVSIKHIGIITSKAGAVRGKHYHLKADQYNYVLTGKMEVRTKAYNQNDKPKTWILSEGEMIFIPKKIIHSVKAVTDCIFLDFNTVSRSGGAYEKDNYKIEDI